MTRNVLLTVLLISVAHALVHIFELALPSVEQLIAAEYRPNNPEAGKLLSGAMANAWRLPFGMGALLAGLLVDRFGSRSMLAVYLLGCGAMCVAAALTEPLDWLFATMIAMGMFGSIYHPAGLSLISHEVHPNALPRALGLHGIFGSIGIGGAPFLAGVLLSFTTAPNWRMVYAVLAIPGIVLGITFTVLALRSSRKANLPADDATTQRAGDESASWREFVTLTLFAVLMGFIYAAVLTFLPRYMDGSGIQLAGVSAAGMRNYLAGGVLLVGCAGQYLAGRFAKQRILERQMLLITLGNLPGLLMMAFADGSWRVIGAVVWALVHFMYQPIYNSLIAKYTPRSRRSLCYGFSFAMGFGFGSFGARFAGASTNNMVTFGTLAAIVIVATMLCGVLMRWAAAKQRAEK